MTDNFLSFSKDAAKTLGLSEAVMLETIKKVINSLNNEFIEVGLILEETIFWSENEVITLLSKLQLRGLINFDKDAKRISLASSGNKAKNVDTGRKAFEERRSLSWKKIGNQMLL